MPLLPVCPVARSIAGMIALAVALLAPGWLLTPRAPGGTRNEWTRQSGSQPNPLPVPPQVLAPVADAPTMAPAHGIEDPELDWRDVPPVEIDLRWPEWETADREPATLGMSEMGPTERDDPYFAPTLELGVDLYHLRLVMPPNAETFRYKLDPSFGIEDRRIQLRGIMLRFKVNF